MLRILTQRQLERIIREREHRAFTAAYCLGYQTAKSEYTSKGFIVSDRVRLEIANLLTRERF